MIKAGSLVRLRTGGPVHDVIATAATVCRLSNDTYAPLDRVIEITVCGVRLGKLIEEFRYWSGGGDSQIIKILEDKLNEVRDTCSIRNIQSE